MIKGKTLTPVLLAAVFFLMLGLSFAAVPLYDMFCRITGFGGTTQVSKEAPNVVLLPHISSATKEARDAMGFRVIKNIDKFTKGETPPDIVESIN